MISPGRVLLSALACLALSGCYVAVHGTQSTSGGSTTSTTSSQVAGAARFSNGVVSISSGPRVAPGTPGGTVSLGKGASGVVVVGLVFADLVNYIVGAAAPRPLPADARIMETCSCYQQQPAMGHER